MGYWRSGGVVLIILGGVVEERGGKDEGSMVVGRGN